MPTPYVKQTWIDGVAGGTPISAARLAYIESGIENATVADSAYVPLEGAGRWELTDYLAADTIELENASMTAGSAIIDCPDASFTAADIGKLVAVCGANTNGTALTTSNNPITAVNSSTQIVATKTAVVPTVAARAVTDGAITRDSQILTSATAAFSGGDVGKDITVVGAGETDRRIVTEYGAITATSFNLTASYACFPTTIVGKRVRVSGAGVAGGELLATVTARGSATSITLDTAATTTMTKAVVESWTIADLITTITRYTNATTVMVRIPATQTVSAASVSIGGHRMVYGTDDRAALQTLLALVSNGDVLTLRRDRRALLGFGTLLIDKRVRFEGQDPESSIIDWGATSGRIQAGVDGVEFENMGFRGLPTSSRIQFFGNSAVDNGYKGWQFYGCVSQGVALTFERVGAVQGNGSTLTNTTDFRGGITLRDVEIRNVTGDGALTFRSIDGADVDNIWCHHNGTDLNDGDQIKVAGGSRNVKIRGGVCEWGARDGIDIFDSIGTLIDGVELRHNAVYGLDAKWTTVDLYTATGQNKVTNVRAWNNLNGGIHATANSSEFTDNSVICNHQTGFRVGAATDIAAGNPSENVNIDGVMALGNGGYGVLLTQALRRPNISNIQTHGNLRGMSLDCDGAVINGVQAFNNSIQGVIVEAAATKCQLNGVRSQDANGSCVLTAGSTFITINGYGEEAGVAGAEPTLASWPMGTLVKHTTDGSMWRRLAAAWEPVALAMANPTPPATVNPNFGATTTAFANGTRWYRLPNDSGFGFISKIALEIVTSSGNIGVAVYANTGTGRAAKPTGIPLATSGMVACPAAGYAELTLGATVFVKPGDWFAYSPDNATVTVRAFSAAPTVTALANGFQWAESGSNLPSPIVPAALASMIGRMPVLIGTA